MRVRMVISDASSKNNQQDPSMGPINWNRFVLYSTTCMQWPPLPHVWLYKLQDFVSKGIKIAEALAIAPHAGNIFLEAKVSFVDGPCGISMNHTEAIAFLKRALHVQEPTPKELELPWCEIGLPTKQQQYKFTAWKDQIVRNKVLPIACEAYFHTWLQNGLQRSDIENVFAYPSAGQVQAQRNIAPSRSGVPKPKWSPESWAPSSCGTSSHSSNSWSGDVPQSDADIRSFGEPWRDEAPWSHQEDWDDNAWGSYRLKRRRHKWSQHAA